MPPWPDLALAFALRAAGTLMRLLRGTVATLNGASASVAGFQASSWLMVHEGVFGMTTWTGGAPSHFKVMAARWAAKSAGVSVCA